MIRAGDLVQLVSPKGKRYLTVVEPGREFHTHDGRLSLDELTDKEFGERIATHLGREYGIFKPTLYDLLKKIERRTQIMYPKDIGYIMIKLGVGPGSSVLEAGSGSGSLTTALAWFVGSQGRVHTFEKRQEFSDLCAKNLGRIGLDQQVVQHRHDIADGFGLKDIDAGFIDVRTPWDYLDPLAEAVRNGSPVGFLLPTTNQVSRLLSGLEEAPFTELEVMEILVRRYKPVSDRLRPDDRMVAHTGYLVFARCQKEPGR
jgi:tRNA (adenine57-N1/adenine58-N1)-methyltransferase